MNAHAKPFYKLSNDTSIYKIVAKDQKKDMSKDDLKKMGLKVYEETDCVLCLCSPPSLVFNVCGHMCVCDSCYKAVANKCPMCNTQNTGVYNVVAQKEDAKEEESEEEEEAPKKVEVKKVDKAAGSKKIAKEEKKIVAKEPAKKAAPKAAPKPAGKAGKKK